jgi:hypothetical protein
MNGSSYGLPNFFVDKGTGYYSVAASRNGAAFVKFEVKAGRAFDGEVTVVVKVESERKTIPLRKVLVLNDARNETCAARPSRKVHAKIAGPEEKNRGQLVRGGNQKCPAPL